MGDRPQASGSMSGTAAAPLVRDFSFLLATQRGHKSVRKLLGALLGEMEFRSRW